MPTTAKAIASMEGRHARFVFFQDRTRKAFPFKSWTVKPIVTKHTDQVNGEKRARSKTIDGYEISGEMYMTDALALQAWGEQQAADDANTGLLDQDGALRFQVRDGTTASYILQDMHWDEFELRQGARNEKIMVSVSMRCADLVEAKTL